MNGIKKVLKCSECLFTTEVSHVFDAVIYCPFHQERPLQEVPSA